MAISGTVSDRGRGVDYNNKRINLKGSSWIEPFGSISMFEDFLASPNTILTESPTTLITQGGTPTTVAIIDAGANAGSPSGGHGGWVGGSTEAADAIQDQVSLGGSAAVGWMKPNRVGNGMLVAEIGFVIPVALTARQYFAGLSDDALETTTLNPTLNIQTAYTLVDVADDAAGFVFSSLATAPTVWKYASTLAGTGSTVSSATEAVTGIVDCYTVCRVEVDVLGNAYFYQSQASVSTGNRVEPTFRGSTALAITPTIALLPKFDAAATTTTAVEWEVDYMFGACAR